MDKPIATDIMPVAVELEEGTRYSFCTCGFSQKGPLCDGAHKEADTDLRSFKFTAEKSGIAYLCMCKKTQNPPYCDGSHSK